MVAHQEVKQKYKVIADQDVVLGFACAGIPGTAVSNRDEALAAFADARRNHAGVLILTEEVALMIREEVDSLRFSAELPLVVQIRGMRGPIAGRKSLADTIRQAIGVSV